MVAKFVTDIPPDGSRTERSDGRTLREGAKVCGEIGKNTTGHEKQCPGLGLHTPLDKLCMETETMESRMEP